ncbi:hypothetical protein ACH5RR_028529 [Cinchona calisaya]|uniref:Myosin motor domain-containing protein n=1 Tax=Cinchona calisaya TaxID=153742 RepID=A0ABD2YP32_9GENT
MDPIDVLVVTEGGQQFWGPVDFSLFNTSELFLLWAELYVYQSAEVRCTLLQYLSLGRRYVGESNHQGINIQDRIMLDHNCGTDRVICVNYQANIIWYNHVHWLVFDREDWDYFLSTAHTVLIRPSNPEAGENLPPDNPPLDIVPRPFSQNVQQSAAGNAVPDPELPRNENPLSDGGRSPAASTSHDPVRELIPPENTLQIGPFPQAADSVVTPVVGVGRDALIIQFASNISDVVQEKLGKICGAKVQTYLLEKSREVQLARGERSYHTFYELCAGALSSLRAVFNASSLIGCNAQDLKLTLSMQKIQASKDRVAKRLTLQQVGQGSNTLHKVVTAEAEVSLQGGRLLPRISQLDGPIPDPYNDVLSTPNKYNYQGVVNEDYNIVNIPSPNDMQAPTPAAIIQNNIVNDDDDDNDEPLNEDGDNDLDDVDQGEDLNTTHVVLVQFDKYFKNVVIVLMGDAYQGQVEVHFKGWDNAHKQ